MPLLGGFPLEYCHDVWYGKTRMAWLHNGEKIDYTITRFERIYKQDRQTLHDGIGCTYA